jgi:hypothetical protein
MTHFCSKIVPAALLCTVLAACGSGDMNEVATLAPVTLATLQGSSDADPAAVAAAALARPPVDGLADAYRADAGSRAPLAAIDTAGETPVPGAQP